MTWRPSRDAPATEIDHDTAVPCTRRNARLVQARLTLGENMKHLATATIAMAAMRSAGCAARSQASWHHRYRGENRADKQDAAGHKSPQMTQRYDHQVPVVSPPKKQ
ncbi:hypothetical protein [Xanthomonas oryzae pv. oryzae MAFF 311018]|nr:hypothetical protein [Xanthomonas oryzae pv. oryzae MAFF 311018]